MSTVNLKADKRNVKLEGKAVVKADLRRVAVNSLIALFLLIDFASAGVGIKWETGKVSVLENEKKCLIYGVYNPWERDIYAGIGASENFLGKIDVHESEAIYVPALTSSEVALPLELCFEVREVYKRDCFFGDVLFCGKDCGSVREVLSGEVLITEVRSPNIYGQSSLTSASVSAPLEIEVECVPYSKESSFIYLGLAVTAIVAVLFLARSERKRK
jgi:hypothetical protein